MAVDQDRFVAQMREAAAAETPEAPTTDTPPAPETEPPGEAAAPDPTPATNVPAPEAETPPDPQGAAEWLRAAGLDIEQLYKLPVPNNRGHNLTFGDLKDAAGDVQEVQRLKLDVQKQRDELTQQQADGNQQLQATLQILVDTVGREQVEKAIQQAPAAVDRYREQQQALVMQFRPDSDYAKDLAGAQQRAQLYDIAPAQLAAASAGLQRAFMRLDQLESYVDTLREPQKPAKQVRQQDKRPSDKPRGRKKQFNTGNRKRDKFVAELLKDYEG